MAAENIILIGMPGAGKSTVGVVLAKRLGMGFVDTDILIQHYRGLRLQQIIETEGTENFLRLEENVLKGLAVTGSVVATGGSAVYSEEGMTALKRNGTVIFLDLPAAEIEERVRNMDSRGLVIDPGQTLADLHRRRLPLYRRHAGMTIECGSKSIEETAQTIISALQSMGKIP